MVVSSDELRGATWPLGRGSVGLNGFIHTESSDRLLLGKQHTLIHDSCEVVHVAVGDSTDKKRSHVGRIRLTMLT